MVGGDVWMDAHGSDHAPAYADLAPSLPIAVGSVPPPLSSRYLYTGEMRICVTLSTESFDTGAGCKNLWRYHLQ